MSKYVIGLDQSTQGTKALVFDENMNVISSAMLLHKQYVDGNGWVEHDLDEIYNNCIEVIRLSIEKFGIDKSKIKALGICNQRETVCAWDKSGKPVCHAIVWQCSRAIEDCNDIEKRGYASLVEKTTGLPLSPYFSASKISWLIKNNRDVQRKLVHDDICFGTVDTYLIYRLTGGKSFKTEPSNASRTQLFNLETLDWDNNLLEIFGIDRKNLPEICDSDSTFGYTDFDGHLDNKIPINAVLGDSQAALFGQGCTAKGMAKATYGTGSSVMMNSGNQLIRSNSGLSTSVGWVINKKPCYVLEGNINYAGAIITWMKNDLKLIDSSKVTEQLAYSANQTDTTYLVPAFSGLGAPYWKNDVLAILCGMSRTTGKNEIVKAGLEAIAYQVGDIIRLMQIDTQRKISELRVDGGPTNNTYLMKLQSALSDCRISVSRVNELSALGVALLASRRDEFKNQFIIEYNPCDFGISKKEIQNKLEGWHKAVEMSLKTE